jgi:predicted SprT family Zn-dependent metalloprotease
MDHPDGLPHPECVSVPSMTPTGGGMIEMTIRSLLRDCGARWGLRGFAESVRVEWGRGFRRSLGRVHLERRLVRLSPELAVAPIAVLLEVLCHEIAHLAVRDLHGGRCRPHGPEWMALVRAAGFEPRRRMPWAAPSPPSRRVAKRRRQYIHRCPVCQLQRTAWRPVRQWRCAACVAAGLSGQLEITSPPLPGKRA